MKADPVILLLDDEKAQLLTLRAQLAGMGKLVEFAEPEPALTYARNHPCDAAIVDVRMPRCSMDGVAFLRALREFDRELGVVIRTASDADEIADRAIELRAIKRAVKSKTTLADLRGSVEEAIRETRDRRRTVAAARETEASQQRLVEALGSQDLRLAAADVNRGLVHSLRNRLTALSALAAVLRGDAARSGDPARSEHARLAAQLVADMVDAVNGFLDGPFGDSGGSSRAAVNVCLSALRQFFEGAERWAVEDKHLAVRDLMSDTFVEAAPLELVNGLRHLAEWFLVRAAPGSQVTLTSAMVHSAAQMTERLSDAGCVLNRAAVRPDRPYVLIKASASLPGTTTEAVREAFTYGFQDGRIGNLSVLGRLLAGAGGAVLARSASSGTLSVEAALPVSL